MKLYRCAACGEQFEGPRAVPGGAIACPNCATALPTEDANRQGDLIIDVRARAEDSSPANAPEDEPTQTARPVFEQRNFAGRIFPGGPNFQGQTWVFRSGGTNDGRGCCGCAFIIVLLLGAIFIRGCASFF